MRAVIRVGVRVRARVKIKVRVRIRVRVKARARVVLIWRDIIGRELNPQIAACSDDMLCILSVK